MVTWWKHMSNIKKIIIASICLLILYGLFDKPIHTVIHTITCDEKCQLKQKVEEIVTIYQARLINPGCIPSSSFDFFSQDKPLHLTAKDGIIPIASNNPNILHFYVASGQNKISILIDSSKNKIYSGSEFLKKNKGVEALLTEEPGYTHFVIQELQAKLSGRLKNKLVFCKK